MCNIEDQEGISKITIRVCRKIKWDKKQTRQIYRQKDYGILKHLRRDTGKQAEI